MPLVASGDKRGVGSRGVGMLELLGSSTAAEGPGSSRSVCNAAQCLFRSGSLLQHWFPEHPENSFPVL